MDREIKRRKWGLKRISILAAVVALIVGLPFRLVRNIPLPGCCRSCGYDLTGNTSGVCPECGREVTTP